jgi:hypothetical protein
MRFNDIAITVNKRLSVKHVVGTWQHMLDARQARYRRSPAYKVAKALREAEVAMKQRKLDALMFDAPKTKQAAAAWIAQWVPLADDIDVDRRASLVAELLKSLGFVSGQHVGETDFSLRIKRIEYIAGQVISMLESVGCVHPIVGKWAKESAQ